MKAARYGLPVFVILGALVVSVVVLGLMGNADRSNLADAHSDNVDPAIEQLRATRPLLHARLNATSAVILSVGLVFIRRRMIRAHASCMILAALTTSTFLVSYLDYHAQAGSMPFSGEGWIRPVYFGVLLSHTVLAAFVAPLAASLFYYAARRDFERHRRIARWTLPMWLYVSATGVLIYLMLYVWYA